MRIAKMSANVNLQNRGNEHFEIEIRVIRVIRTVLSILLIFNGLFRFLDHLNSLAVYDMIYSITTVVGGIFFMLWNSGVEKISVTVHDNSLYIKWAGRIRGEELMLKEIDYISLSKSEVEIRRAGVKRMNYRLDNLDVSQKRQVYDYFIRFSMENDILLERHFDTN